MRPSCTAATIEAKLSSSSTICAASLAASVPLRPIAMPISACFNDGASLTPSPVIATTSPLACKARTMRSLCSGLVRAKTLTSCANLRSPSSDTPSSSAPVIT